VDAVRVVSEGNALLAPSVTRRIVEEFAQRPVHSNQKDELKRLTEREAEVLRVLARGKTNAEIADELSVGEPTVKTHVSNLLTKLGLRDRIQAVVFAYESGLVRPGAE
jgi:DNA-binding NarL/FixJ family response regulator